MLCHTGNNYDLSHSILVTQDTDNFTSKHISSEGQVVPVTDILLFFEAYDFSSLKRLDISPEANENFIAIIEHIENDSVSQVQARVCEFADFKRVGMADYYAEYVEVHDPNSLLCIDTIEEVSGSRKGNGAKKFMNVKIQRETYRDIDSIKELTFDMNVIQKSTDLRIEKKTLATFQLSNTFTSFI